MSSFVGQAQDMLSNPLTRKAFDLSTESEATRDRYGRGHRGQCYLLGRKLIEAGVRIVTVDVREPMTDSDARRLEHELGPPRLHLLHRPRPRSRAAARGRAGTGSAPGR